MKKWRKLERVSFAWGHNLPVCVLTLCPSSSSSRQCNVHVWVGDINDVSSVISAPIENVLLLLLVQKFFWFTFHSCATGISTHDRHDSANAQPLPPTQGSLLLGSESPACIGVHHVFTRLGHSPTHSVGGACCIYQPGVTIDQSKGVIPTHIHLGLALLNLGIPYKFKTYINFIQWAKIKIWKFASMRERGSLV